MALSLFHKLKEEGPLYALFLNCTLKCGPDTSNTGALCQLLIEGRKALPAEIETEIVRVVDYSAMSG